MRVLAILLVMLTHCTEPFYLGGEGTQILSRTDAFWVAIINTFARACVPMFVVASAYLQFPIHYSTGEFFKRRFVRIVIPFVFWTVVYALVWGEPVGNFRNLAQNFNYAAGHLWFVYMILGLYLIMPMLSPWAEKVSKRELQVYIAIWLVSTLLPIVRDILSEHNPPVIYGPFGLPNIAKYPLWGEASWNTYGILYYLSGFVGYMLVGLYFRKFAGDISRRKSIVIGTALFIVGYLVSGGGFLYNVLGTTDGEFPFGGKVGIGAVWETTWFNDSFGVALMTIGWIYVLRNIRCDGKFYQKVILNFSKAGYGVYLSHMLVLLYISGYFRKLFGMGADSTLGLWTAPVEILLGTIVSFIIVNVAATFIQRIPKIGKYIIG